MPYPPHALVQFGGELGQLSGPPEIWSCGIRVVAFSAGGGAAYLSDPQAYATALGAKLVPWFSANTQIPLKAVLTFLKVNNIAPDGKYVDPITHQASIGRTAGGGGAAGAPAFCSVALTLETGVTRGHASRGRIYLPNYVPVPTGCQISAGDVTTALTQGKNLLNAISTAVIGTGGAVPIVASKLGTGAWRQVTALSVDNIYDYQSRRKDRAQSTRTTGPAA